jgi:tetratricopeptide (TPR) repeat protein
MPPIRTEIAPPANPGDFERLVLRLLQKHWGNPNLQLYGRLGQTQNGIDIFDPTASTPHRAAQCKRYDPSQPLKSETIERAVDDALGFLPKLNAFALITTAKQATESQQTVKAINLDLQSKGLFLLEYFTWSEVEDLLNQYSAIWREFYPCLQPDGIEVIVGETQKIYAAVQAIGAEPASGELDAELDRCKALLENRKPDEARLFLQQIVDRHWHRLSDRQRFRAKANLAASWSAVGEYQKAGTLYIEAARFQRDDPRALANESLGYLLLGEVEKAYSLADVLRQKHPEQKLALVVWINASPTTESTAKLSAEIPKHLLDDVEVGLALAHHAYLQQDWKNAVELARSCTKIAEGNSKTWALLGRAVIRGEVSSSWERLGLPTRLRSQEKAAEAEEYLSKALELARQEGNPEMVVELLIDRAAIRAMREDRIGARQDAEEARSIRPKSVAVRKEYAEILRMEQFLTPAIEMIRSIRKEDGGPDVQAMLALTLRQRGQAGDIEEAAAGFRGIAHSREPLPPGLREAAMEWGISSFSSSGAWEAAQELVASVPSEHLSESLRHYFYARIKLLRKDSEGAVREALLAAQELTPNSRPDELRQIALILGDAGEFQQAYPLWNRLVEISKLSSDRRYLLQCVSRLGRDREALEICQSLRALGENDERLFTFEVSLLERYDTNSAITLLQARIEKQPLDKVARLHLSTIGLRIDRPDLVHASPDGLPSVDEVAPSMALAVVRVIKMGHSAKEAVLYAYRILRKHFDDVDAHRAFLLAMAPFGPEPDIKQPEAVVAGSAVRYRELGAEHDQVAIIEDSEVPEPKFNEIGPEHPLSRELLGKKVGERFAIASGRVSKREAIVVGILDKFVYRYQDSLGQWQVRFPDLAEVESIRLMKKPGSDDELDLTPFLQSLDRRRDFRQEMIQNYALQPMSIHFFGRAFNQNTFDALIHLATSEDTFVKCVDGSGLEMRRALESLTTRSVVVLDLSAIGTLFALRQVEVLRTIPGRFAVSSGTINELREMVSEIVLPSTQTGYAGKNEDGYYFIPEDASGRRQRAVELRSLIKTIEETCQVTACLELAAIEQSKRELILRVFGPDGAESMVLATQPGHLLWTDDAVVGGFAATELGVERVWTQIVLQWMAQAGSLEETVFHDCSAKLFGWGYRFTSLSSNSLVRGGVMSGWNPTHWPLSKCLEVFGFENVDLGALISIAGRFLPEMYRVCALPQLREAIVVRLLDTLRERRGGLAAARSIHSLLRPLFGVNVLGADEVNQIFDAWFKASRGV